MKKFLVYIITFIMFTGIISSVSFGKSVPSMTDTANHWAREAIQNAVHEGWVNGYEDGSFKPDHTVTRAEFIKLVRAALNFSNITSDFITDASKYYRNNIKLNGIANHWVNKQGWINSSVAFGLIEPTDYQNNDFGPDTPITRREIVVILDRALGLVQAAEAEKGIKLPFSDDASTPSWSKGYIHQGVKKGFINGYPDGTFKQGQPATRAEAVLMIQKALKIMRQGIDTEYKLFVNNEEIVLSAPIQIIDGMAFVPVRDIIASQNPTMELIWNPVEQCLSFNWEVYFKLRPESTSYEYNGLYPIEFTVNTRMLNGEIMFPLGNMYEGYYYGGLWNAQWNKENKTIHISITQPSRPNAS